MVETIEISLATLADMPIIGIVCARSMRYSLIDTFTFGFERADGVPSDGLAMLLSKLLEDPKQRIFKGVLKSTGEIVGFARISFQNGEINLPTPGKAFAPPGANPDFAAMYFGKLAAMWMSHMKGKEHVVLHSLFVHPEYQRKGIGTALLRWAFAEYGLEEKLVWLATMMDGRNYWRRYGWKDVDCVEVDLAEWGGKDRGFGLHKSPMMLRQPGKLVKIEGITHE